MNVRDLIERLEGLNPEATVLLATQPGWPLQFEVSGVASAEDIAMDNQCAAHEHYTCDDCAAADSPVVYIVEGGTPDHPYAPRAAWDVAS